MTVNTEYDPFADAAFLRWVRDRPTWQLIGYTISTIVAVLAASAIEGQLGYFHLTNAEHDIGTALGVAGFSTAEPHFPLARDLVSWYTGLSAPYTAWVARRQWCLMSVLFRDLDKSGVLGKHYALPRRRGQLARRLHEPRSVSELQQRSARALTIISRWWPVCLLVATLLSAALMYAESETLFLRLAPTHIPAGQWQQKAYEGWWAAWTHKPGCVAYFFVCTCGFFMVILVVAVGAVAAYVTWTLPKVTHLGVDWLNLDGRYGWRSIDRIYRTVYTAMIIHGSVVFTFFFLIGPRSSVWILPLIVMLLGSAMAFLILPFRIFGRVADEAKECRIELLRPMASRISNERPVELVELARVVSEIERVHTSRIQPLFLKGGQIPAVVAVGAIPVAIGVGEIAVALLR